MSRFWPHFFLLAIFEGLAALVALLLVPSEGLSLARLALFGIIFLPLIASTWLFVHAWNDDWRARVIDATIDRPNFFRGIVLASSLLLLTFGLLLFLLRYYNPEATAPYFVRTRPALTYLLLLSAQTCLWLTALRNGIHPQSVQTRRTLLVPAVIGFGVFVIIWLIIVFTGLGITKDTSYWGEPGVPILGWQLILALLIGFLFLLFVLRFTFPRRADLLIAFLVWLLAIGLWMSVPLTTLRNSFYAPITPPFNQPFPASDAAYYDSDAQSLLMGYGFVHPIPSRPLFILFLAGLHALLGQDYARLVFGQTLVLALLPVALYFVGRQLHSRAAGVTVSLFAILRELTSLWVASEARVSNTKMLLSDFITTLALVAYLLLILRWFGRKNGGTLLAFAAGGLHGLLLLLRTQSAFLAPGVLLLACLVFWPDWKKWFAQSALFAAGLVLAISPWLARNYFVTGQLSLDDPTQIKAVASMYSGGTPTSNFSQFDGQTPEEMSRFVVDTILHRPAYVAGFVSNQFIGNAIDTLLVLPIFARYDGLTAPIHLYWYEWDGHLSPANAALFIIYLAVIALGLAAAWKRLRWAGLTPLVFFIFYAFATSLARFSGWRYIFPADWVGYFYFALGAVELFSMIAVLFGADVLRAFPTSIPQTDSPPAQGRWFAILAGLFLLVGSLPWIAESVIPRAQPLCADSVPACLSSLGVDESQATIFISQPDARALTGRALYPRYFPRNQGLASTNPNPAFAPRDFPRMGFYFLTPNGVAQVVLSMKGSRPFPHATDAILLGCQRDQYIEVRLIVFPETRETFVNGSLEDSCQTP